MADGRHFVNRAKEECASYRGIYREPIPGKMLAERISMFVQAYTLYSSVRPFGSSAILGVYGKHGPELFMVEPSGVYWVNVYSTIGT